VLLFGAQLSFVIQYPTHTAHFLSRKREHFRLPSGFPALSVAVESAKAALAGSPPPNLSELSYKWTCPKEVLIEEVLTRTPQFFHSTSADDDIYYLSQDSDKILIQDLLPVFPKNENIEFAQYKFPNEIKILLSLLEEERGNALQGLTVRDLLNSNISLRPPKAI